MKKIIVSLLMVFVACSALFATNDSNTVSLKNTVAAHQQIIIKYGNEIVEGNNNPFTVDLKSGTAEKISLVWTGNTDNSKQNGFYLNIVAKGFKNSNAKVEEGYVRVIIEGLPKTSTAYVVTDDNGNIVGEGEKAGADAQAGISYKAKENTYGSYTFAEFTPKWNGNYNWTAGEYRCDIEVYINAL